MNEVQTIKTEHFRSRGKCQAEQQPALTAFGQLAMSLVFDLGLNKPVRKEPHIMSVFSPHCVRIPMSTVRSMEERRAVLGCFLMTSA